MQRVRITQKNMPGKHWLVYCNDDHIKKHIYLPGCAETFELSTGYRSNDGLRAVGWHYEEGGQLCYELFNVGHTILYAPLQLGPVHTLLYRLRMKNPVEEHRAFLQKFEDLLNQGGWKTIAREEVGK